jgi:hypothetical protein
MQMINQLKLQTYKYFNGDIDSWARAGTFDQKSIMDDKDWALIDSLMQDLFLVRKGLTTLERAEELELQLKIYCDGDDTIRSLKEMCQ